MYLQAQQLPQSSIVTHVSYDIMLARAQAIAWRSLQAAKSAGRVSARAFSFLNTPSNIGIRREPFSVCENAEPAVAATPEEAVKDMFGSRGAVFFHSAAATPQPLVDAVVNMGAEKGLENVTTVHIHTEGSAPQVAPEHSSVFRDLSLFVGGNVRAAVNDGRADAVPIFLSDIPLLFRRGKLELDLAIVNVSPPDAHGFCSLGVSVDTTRSAVQCARHVVAMINPSMPRTFGDSLVHMSHFSRVLHMDRPLHQAGPPPLTPAFKAIGQHVATHLVADGATLQMGIGGIPDAVLSCLTDHQDLGIHTEMFSDGMLDLVEQGVITNRFKCLNAGAIVSTFAMGSQRLYDFINDNPGVHMLDVEYTNDVRIISQQPRMTAINSAIEVDLTGQVVADSIGKRMYSGVGGQIDFLRGAAQSENGVPIVALPSTTRHGASRIVPTVKEGAGITTTRAHVHYIVTEYGIAEMFGKSLRERANALVGIAHPDHREALDKEVFERFGRHG